MLMMRRHEKDFMLRRDRKYGDDMKKRASEFVEFEKRYSWGCKDRAQAEARLLPARLFAWMEPVLTLADELRRRRDRLSAVEPVIGGIGGGQRHQIEAERSNTAMRDSIQRQWRSLVLLIAFAVLADCSSAIGFRPLSA